MTFRERAKELVAKMTLEEKISQMCSDAPAIERLGVPAYNWWNECLHGIARQGTATVFPQAIGMAASFDTELMYRVAVAISDEARAKYNEFRKFGYTQTYQGLTFWSPNINIFRDPRWGRGHETYGEDPYLTGRMGTAFVKGLQGDGKYRKLDATLKHFAVHSGPEGCRHGFDAKISEKDLYETYLAAFRYCIENAKPAAVMGAYNSINGKICCGSKELLSDILRDELGFEGYVVSDCGAVSDIHGAHKATASPAESAALAVNNGCQLECGTDFLHLGEAVEQGLITEETITEAVEILFESRFTLGMFDEDCEYNDIPFDVVDCEEHRALNRRIAAKSCILLKNNGILPLKENMTVAVIGPAADDKSVLLGNYNGTPARYSTLLHGIQDGSDNRVIYAKGCDYIGYDIDPWDERPLNEAIIAAKKADVVILCVGLNPSLEGEENGVFTTDISNGDKTTLELSKIQRELAEEITRVGKPMIYVNVSGSCLDLSFAKEHADAVIQCFYPGAEGGNALADIIFGKVSPCGRLPVTFYRSVDDLPPFEDYSMDNRTYKFFGGETVYEFGHGLTYSEIEEKKIDENTYELTNKGEYDTDYSLLKFEYIPHKSLCDFKTVHLKKGETVTVKFE